MTSDHNGFSSLERFDGAAAWGALTPEQQAEIGAIALEFVVAINGHDAYSGLTEAEMIARPFQTAEPLLADWLLQAGEEALREAVPALLDDRLLIPIPSRLGRVCRICACSEYDACPEGCSWAEPDLCTACKAAEAA